MIKNLPSFEYEQSIWKQGFNIIAGMDEVGRGSWAGPVVAAACAFAPEFRIENLECRIDDSKRLSTAQREIADEWIKKNALAWSIGEVGVSVINRVGIGKATAIAFRRAIAECNRKLEVGSENRIDYLLIDAFYVPYVNGVPHDNQMPIIKGDQKSISIAAASIIAKVYRDALMISLSKQFKFKEYGWERNKAYGTREHQEAIKIHGITGLHRVQFVESWKSRSVGQWAASGFLGFKPNVPMP